MPVVLNIAAEEALAQLENRPSTSRPRFQENVRLKAVVANARVRRYVRARVQPPILAAISGPRSGSARVRVLALGGAFLETEQRMVVGESMQLEIRNGLRKIQTTAVVRNMTATGAGVEFVHMKPRDRERLRRLIAQFLK